MFEFQCLSVKNSQQPIKQSELTISTPCLNPKVGHHQNGSKIMSSTVLLPPIFKDLGPFTFAGGFSGNNFRYVALWRYRDA